MIFLLIFYLLFSITLTLVPFLVFRYIMAGDEYLVASNIFYPILWIGGIVFVISNFFTTIRNTYECLYQSKRKNKWSPTILLRTFHSIMVSSIYNSLYITIFALVGYIFGILALDNIPKFKDLFMSVVHIPAMEYILKGLPLTLGAILGNILTSFCVENQCGGK